MIFPLIFRPFYIALALLSLLLSCKKDPLLDDGLDLIPIGTDKGPLIVNETPIEGYTDKVSYFPGDSVHLCISVSDSSSISFDLYRYGLTTELISSENNIVGRKQNYHKYSYSYGCDWDTTYSFRLGDSLRSGIYCAVIKNSDFNTDYLSFVVKERRDESAPAAVLVLASTNTWQAYNNWGGGSFYRYDVPNKEPDESDIRNSVIISFKRPNRVDKPIGDKGHLTNAELHLLRWLEAQGIKYAMCSDADIHASYNQFNNRKLIMLNVHSEYWTTEMLDHAIDFYQSGGGIMYLSGNGMYWKTAMSPDGKLECRKDHDSFKYAAGKGGKWSELGRSPALLIGTEYSKSGYNTYAPYECIAHDHWVFEGTNLAKGDLFGSIGLNGGGASGHETDKRTEFTPKSFKLLAKGTNPDFGGAEMVIQEVAGLGVVFSVSSITYTGALSEDENISKITLNVLERMMQ